MFYVIYQFRKNILSIGEATMLRNGGECERTMIRYIKDMIQRYKVSKNIEEGDFECPC